MGTDCEMHTQNIGTFCWCKVFIYPVPGVHPETSDSEFVSGLIQRVQLGLDPERVVVCNTIVIALVPHVNLGSHDSQTFQSNCTKLIRTTRNLL
jgi:hypothetical protein